MFMNEDPRKLEVCLGHLNDSVGMFGGAFCIFEV